jgi:CHAT domain-containing protein
MQRIDAIVEHFRKTGEYQSRLPELVQIDAELAASNRTLAERGDWPALALGLIKQGHCYRMQGQWDRAIPFYQLAEQAALRGQNPGRQSEALTWKAQAETSRRNLGQAAADARQAVQLAEKAGDNDVLAHALEVLGNVQVSQFDLVAAGDTFNRTVSVAKQARDPMKLHFAYLGRADVYQKSAERCGFQRAFEPCRQALEHARADLEQALVIVRQQAFAGLVRHVEQLLKGLEIRRGMNESEEKRYGSAALKDAFRPKTPRDVLATERFIAEPGGVPPLLVAMYEETKRSSKNLGGLDVAVNEARNYFLEGRMHELRGNNDAALDFYLKAVNTLEGDRRALRDERSRGTFLEDRIVFYYAAAMQLLEHKRYADAFAILERSRSRALADLLATRQPGLGRPGEQKLYAESAVLRTRIADAQGRLFELASQADATKYAPQVVSLQTQIRSLESQLEQLTARMAVEAPRLQNLLTSGPASLEALQRSMREERYEMLQYLVIDEAVIVWHIAPGSVNVRNVFLPRNQLIDKVTALRKSLADRNAPFDETTAQELFLYLVAPVLPLIRSDRLVIVPHEDLHYVPFQVFKNPGDGRYLGERVQITYAPSATVLLGLARPVGLSGGRLLAVADPSIMAAVPEVSGIAKLFPGQAKIVANELAREADVKTWIRDFDVIHLSVHGKFDAAEPMLSYLSFARGADDDGRLTAAEMFGLPLERNRLVVLSACETGRAEATYANEILGMVRGLLYAGAGTLVLSYWEVDSAATALWMQAFYEAALTQPLPAAARTALLKVKNTPQYRHPYYWSAFGMTGR